MPSDQTESIGGRGGFDDVVSGVEDDRGRGKHGQNLGDALRQVIL